ncbi:hypothetical protein GWO43_30230 [candidate division KSB1 bacterium]|nr:hypothetical protein [candidate division KSB1 bacterium]NIV70636.1 hypothetical protein [Phycisphaerae bacterium]NIS28169.1 hypothetical protein [candidate division KSB1 bacterium]NIT75061.1 hypothetical protein [candidate division KSB1 bacterium]NIU28847.1 hypothetical protein [candidate division KSB1 bacterium]
MNKKLDAFVCIEEGEFDVEGHFSCGRSIHVRGDRNGIYFVLSEGKEGVTSGSVKFSGQTKERKEGEQR